LRGRLNAPGDNPQGKGEAVEDGSL